MAVDLKLLATLDTTQVMSGLHELRSQLGMSLASATGFQSAAMSMAGTPNLGGSGFGQTHTNAAMAYSPHYGAVQATTSMAQEAFVQRGGLAAAHQLAPPGVSDVSYQMTAMSNAIERDINARRESSMAAKEAFFTSAGGMAVGSATGWVGQKIGAGIGGAIGGRFFGAGGVKAGEFLGGAIGGLGGYFLGSDAAERAIGGSYAKDRQIEGVTSELGALMGGGRGLTRVQQYDLGAAALGAAKDLKMDVNEMGDILALGRQSGMLPTATDPGKAREQIREFARAIDEGAQVLQTSLAGATQVIKTAVQSGMSAQEGVVRAAGAGGADIWLQQRARMNAFAGAGASVGMSMGFTPGQGSAMFTGSLGAAGAAGLSGAETRIMGGRFGAAQFVGTTQMAMAASPTGDLQLMAAMGGYGGGGSMMDMAGAAMGAMGDGDMISNMIKFQVHKNEYRRGIGASGIRTMARDQLRMGAEMIQSIAPDISMNEAQRMYAMSMGLNPDQAKTLVGGGAGGGGGGAGGGMGARSQARAIIAMQEQRLASQGVAPIQVSERRGFTVGSTTAEMAGMGAIMGKGVLSLPGAAIGAGIGLLVENAGAIKDVFTGGMTKREAEAEHDRRMAAVKEKIGYYDMDEDALTNWIGKDLSSAELSFVGAGATSKEKRVAGLYEGGLFDAHAGIAIYDRKLTGHERTMNNAVAMAKAIGLKNVGPGPGTIELGPDFYVPIGDWQKVTAQPMYSKGLSAKDRGIAEDIAFAARGGGAMERFAEQAGWGGATTAQKRRAFDEKRWQLAEAYRSVAAGGVDAQEAADTFNELLPQFIGAMDISDKRKAALQERATREVAKGGAASEFVFNMVKGITGDNSLEQAYAANIAGTTGVVASTLGLANQRGRRSSILASAMGADADIAIMARASRSADLSDMSSGVEAATRVGQRERLINTMTNRSEYSEFKQAVLRGDKDRARQLWKSTLERSAVEADVVGDVDLSAVSDPYERIHAGKNEAKLMSAGAGVVGFLGAMTGSKTLDKIQTRLNVQADKLRDETTSIADKVKEEEGKGGLEKAFGKRRRSSSPLQRAAGFGAREDAMSTINRSLKHTEKMLKNTSKAVGDLAETVKQLKGK